jgi:DNA repair protein RecO (recombination protein O)
VNQREKILVLKVFKHGESDLIVHGLNPLGARMGFIAKGGAKSRKRFAGGVLEATHYIEVVYKVNSSGGGDSEPLHTLLEANIVREFTRLRTDYARLEAALYMLKLVHKLSQHGVIDSPETFNLLGNGLAAAETSSDVEALKLHFEVKLMAGQGVLPHEDIFQSWLQTPLAQHERIQAGREARQNVASQIHDHLRHYLGQI